MLSIYIRTTLRFLMNNIPIKALITRTTILLCIWSLLIWVVIRKIWLALILCWIDNLLLIHILLHLLLILFC